jgi:hypothetical protein
MNETYIYTHKENAYMKLTVAQLIKILEACMERESALPWANKSFLIMSQLNPIHDLTHCIRTPCSLGSAYMIQMGFYHCLL